MDLIIEVFKGVQVRIQSLLNSLIILYALEIRGLPLSCVGLLFQILELSRPSPSCSHLTCRTRGFIAWDVTLVMLALALILLRALEDLVCVQSPGEVLELVRGILLVDRELRIARDVSEGGSGVCNILNVLVVVFVLGDRYLALVRRGHHIASLGMVEFIVQLNGLRLLTRSRFAPGVFTLVAQR